MKKDDTAKAILTGNSFPMNLIRREVRIEPRTLDEYRETLQQCRWVSYWGHKNTLPLVNELLQLDLTPRSERPAITLDSQLYPSLGGESFRECWVLSPEYREGFRPAIGSETTPGDIRQWLVQRIIWM